MSGKVVKERGEAKHGNKPVLDGKDKKILRCLCEDARMPISSISEITGLQRDVVVYRINKMKDLGVISAFRPITNPPTMGLTFINYVSFKLKNYSIEDGEKFMEYLKKNKHIMNINELTGEWDVLALVASRDVEDFDLFLKGLRENFSTIIHDFNTNTVIKSHKNDGYIDLI